MAALALLLLSVLPHSEPIRERCDVLERNHFYDDCGRLVFTQLIGWRWYDDVGEHHVGFWRLEKLPAQRPVYRHDSGDWVVLWQDGEVFREVRAGSFVETWGQVDPEVSDRERLPANERADLVQVKAKVFP